MLSRYIALSIVVLLLLSLTVAQTSYDQAQQIAGDIVKLLFPLLIAIVVVALPILIVNGILKTILDIVR